MIEKKLDKSLKVWYSRDVGWSYGSILLYECPNGYSTNVLPVL